MIKLHAAIVQTLPIKKFCVSVIFLFAALIFSNAVAQNQSDLRQCLYPPFAQPHWTEKTMLKKTISQPDSNLTLVGTWPWGPCLAVTAKNNYAFIGNGGLFQAMDISNPRSPQIIGELRFGGLLIHDMALKGDWVFIADGDIKIIDVSQPATPQIVGKLLVPEDFVYRVMIVDNSAYVGTVGGQLFIVDISSPTSPVIKSTTLFDYNIAEMALYGDYLYLTIGHPLYPIYIYNVSEPGNPTLAGYYPMRNYGFTAAGHYLYLSAAEAAGNSFQILDLTIPTQPQLVGRLQTPLAGRMTIKNNLAYMITSNPLLAIIDVSDPTQPVLRGTATGSPGTIGSGFAVVPPLVLVPTEIGFWTIDVSQPDLPSPLNYFATGDASSNMEIMDNFLFLCSLKAGLFVVDISNPQIPQFVSNVSVGGWVDDIAIADSLAYLSGYPFGGNTPPELRIVNISKSTLPKLIAHIPVFSERPQGGYPTAVAVLGHHSFVTYDQGFSIINVVDQQNPRLVKSIITGGTVIDIASTENLVCLAHAEKGLRIFDVSDPENPQEKSVFPGFTSGVITRNDTAFVALGGGLAILKILSSGIAVKIGGVNTPGSRSTVDLAIQNNFAYMAYGEDLFVIDISNPRQPLIAGHALTPAYARGVAIKASEVFVAGSAWALQVYRNKLVTHVDEKRFDRLPSSPRLYPNYPNPLQTSAFIFFTTIEYEIPQAGPVELKVFNSLGQEVSQLVNGWQNTGRHRISFNAKNLSNGVYFCRLRFKEWQVTQKMLIVKMK